MHVCVVDTVLSHVFHMISFLRQSNEKGEAKVISAKFLKKSLRFREFNEGE